jgi:hypothetical protein
MPIVQEAEWTPGPVWRGEDTLALTGIGFPDIPGPSESLWRLRYPFKLPGRLRLKLVKKIYLLELWICFRNVEFQPTTRRGQIPDMCISSAGLENG